MTLNKSDYQRLAYLGNAINNKTATKAETNEYMSLMLKNGQITQTQYNDYIQGAKSDEILNATLAVGVILLLGYVLSEMFSRK